VDVVIFAAGAGGGASPDKTMLIDERGAIKAIDLAKEHNVDKFIMLSAVGADNPSEIEIEESMKVYYESKYRADTHLENSGVTYTIIRPGLLTNEKATGNIRAGEKLQDREGKITRADVAEVMVKSIKLSNLDNKAIEILNDETEIDAVIKNV